MTMTIRHLNSETLPRNPAFSQAVAVEGAYRTVWVGGQIAVDAGGNVVGKGDVAAQAEQTARNLLAVLAAADAGVDDVVKLTVYVVAGQSALAASEGFQRVWGTPANPPARSLVYVSALFHPDFLIEVDAVAVVAQ